LQDVHQPLVLLIYECLVFELNIFVLVINFIDDCHVPLFEAQETLNVVLTLFMKALLAKFKFTNKIIVYVKNERRNLNTLVVTLTLVVNYVPLTPLTLQ
jgi:hypothetical protein